MLPGNQICEYTARKEEPSTWHGERPEEWFLDAGPPAGLDREIWECPHDQLEGDEYRYCAFHTDPEEVPQHVDEAELFVKTVNETNEADEKSARRKKEFIGANFGEFNIPEDTILDANDNHPIRLDHAWFLEGVTATGVTIAHDFSAQRARFVTSANEASKNPGVSFRNAEFTSDNYVKFLMAEFVGDDSVTFSGARFTDASHVNFEYTSFGGEGSVSFANTRFMSGGILSFENSNFTGGDISFSGGKFNGSISFGGAEFNDYIEVSFSGTRFIGDSGVSFKGTVFSGPGKVGFEYTKFAGDGEVSFWDANFTSSERVQFGGVEFLNEGDVLFGGVQFGENSDVSFNGTVFATDGDVNFRNVDLSGVHLEGVNFEGADFRGTNLTDADLREANLSRIQVNQSTQCGRQKSAHEEASSPEDWDSIARSYHALKSAFSNHGLVNKARQHHVLERNARREEARETGDYGEYFSAYASRLLTGYGVDYKQLVLSMFILFAFSTIVFWYSGVEESVFYSVVTFTTAPPHSPPPGFPKWIAMVETLLGTLFTVLLGYVLGNRESF